MKKPKNVHKNRPTGRGPMSDLGKLQFSLQKCTFTLLQADNKTLKIKFQENNRVIRLAELASKNRLYPVT